jgi:methionyl-tRNA synthetase
MITVKVECPHCRRSLMDSQHLIHGEDSISLVGQLPDGKKGTIRLSSQYGDYDIDTALMIPEDTVVEFSCPYCKESLKSCRKCEGCEAHMAAVQLPQGGKVQFCTKRGCKGHLLEFIDPEEDLRAFYEEYSQDT